MPRHQTKCVQSALCDWGASRVLVHSQLTRLGLALHLNEGVKWVNERGNHYIRTGLMWGVGCACASPALVCACLLLATWAVPDSGSFNLVLLCYLHLDLAQSAFATGRQCLAGLTRVSPLSPPWVA